MATGSLPGLLSWEAGVYTDGDLLSDVLQEKLKPLQLRIVAAKNVPMHETKPAPNPLIVPCFARAYVEPTPTTRSILDSIEG